MSEDLKKQAQEKLAEARRLIREAGELAKQGQFVLHFGEIGDFVPRAFFDRDLLREQAIANLKAEGRYNGNERVEDLSVPWGYSYRDLPRTPWDEIPEREREDAIEVEIDSIREDMDVPSEMREYGSIEDADQWWHPSRC